MISVNKYSNMIKVNFRRSALPSTRLSTILVSPYLLSRRPFSYKVDDKSQEWTGRESNPQRSTAMEHILKVPVTVVDGPTAICDGGGGELGHPLAYINLNDDVPDEPKVCLYCGLRYVMKPESH